MLEMVEVVPETPDLLLEAIRKNNRNQVKSGKKKKKAKSSKGKSILKPEEEKEALPVFGMETFDRVRDAIPHEIHHKYIHPVVDLEEQKIEEKKIDFSERVRTMV
jgi:hypothetical protein